MIALEVADLVIIASRTLRLDTGLVLDLLDPAAAESALAQGRPDSEPGDPAVPAAALLHALVRERPLRRGNQQVALAAALQFLALNGWEVDPEPPADRGPGRRAGGGHAGCPGGRCLAGAPGAGRRPLHDPSEGGTHATQPAAGREDQDGRDA